MPVTFTQLVGNTAIVEVPCQGGTATVVYFPGKITEKIFAQLQLMQQVGATAFEQFSSLNTILCTLVKSWDVMDDQPVTIDAVYEAGQISVVPETVSMYPLVPDRLAELPILFRADVLTAILSDIRPEEVAPKQKTRKKS